MWSGERPSLMHYGIRKGFLKEKLADSQRLILITTAVVVDCSCSRLEEKKIERNGKENNYWPLSLMKGSSLCTTSSFAAPFVWDNDNVKLRPGAYKWRRHTEESEVKKAKKCQDVRQSCKRQMSWFYCGQLSRRCGNFVSHLNLYYCRFSILLYTSSRENRDKYVH